jgi:hypothetical protein
LFEGVKPYYIVSVHPREFTHTALRSGSKFDPESNKWVPFNRLTYVLKAAPKGSYSSLLIEDTWQKVTDTNNTDANGAPTVANMPTKAAIEARSLLSLWANDCVVGSVSMSPGLMILDHEKPPGS